MNSKENIFHTNSVSNIDSSPKSHQPVQNTLESFTERAENQRDIVTAKLWIPLSLLVAMMHAVSNEIKSKISAFHMDAMFLIAPSAFASWIVLSIIFLIKAIIINKIYHA